MTKTYYETLGLKPDASQEDIKKAFRKLAGESHPDKHDGNPEWENRFKEVNKAHQVLSNPLEKAEYDRSLQPKPRINFRYSAGSPINDFADSFFSNVNIHDPFEEILRNSRGADFSKNTKPAPTPGDDVEITVTVAMEDVLIGTKKQVRFKRGDSRSCPRCGGSGAEHGSQLSICPNCDGNGRVVDMIAGRPGAKACSSCTGTGQVSVNKCSTCLGAGRVDVARDIVVTIPKGLRDGQNMRIRGHGRSGSPPGDLIIVVSVKDSSNWWARGEDLFTVMDVSLPSMLSGDSLSVTLPDGSIFPVLIPEGGGQSRIKGAWKNPAGKDGDLVAIFRVKAEGLSLRGERLAKELLEEIEGRARQV